MKTAVIYSSVTGNTKSVAEAIHAVMPEGALLAPVHKAPDPDDLTCRLWVLGFWVKRGKPDPRMMRYMGRLRGKNVAWFGTLAARPDSPHADAVRKNTEALLCGNTVLGGFLCMGRLEARRFAACMSNESANASTHPMTPERKARLIEASRHPDEADFAAARERFRFFLSRMR